MDEDKSTGFFARQTTKVSNKFKKVIGAEGIQDGYGAIKEYGQVLDPRKKRNVRVESFEDSYARHGVTEERYEEIYKVMWYKFYTIVAVFGAIILWMVYLALDGRIFTMVSACGVLAVAGALAVTTAFRLHQLSIRNWCTFKEWFNNESGWWPMSWEEASNQVDLKKKRKK